jgi:integrase
MAKAGLRPSEVYALQPDDLNLQARIMRVERALDLYKAGKPTKTYERRTVRLSSSLVQTLRRHLSWLKSEALLRGWPEITWLFPTEVNTPLDESRAKKVFHRARKEARLPYHGLTI